MMDEEQKTEIYKKFPVILRAKLIDNEMELPKGTQFSYEPIPAYRAIQRRKNDNTPFGRNDLLSKVERKNNPRGISSNNSSSEYTIEDYAASLFKDRTKLNNTVKFKDKKIAFGSVMQENGPQHTRQADGHINWWLYERVDISNFVIEEE